MPSDTFCILPWINISTRANGDLRVCCHANQGPTRGIYKKEDGTNYNLNSDKITDAINSPNRLWICGKTCGKELDFRGNGEKNFEDTEMNEYA